MTTKHVPALCSLGGFFKIIILTSFDLETKTRWVISLLQAEAVPIKDVPCNFCYFMRSNHLVINRMLQDVIRIRCWWPEKLFCIFQWTVAALFSVIVFFSFLVLQLNCLLKVAVCNSSCRWISLMSHTQNVKHAVFHSLCPMLTMQMQQQVRSVLCLQVHLLFKVQRGAGWDGSAAFSCAQQILWEYHRE